MKKLLLMENVCTKEIMKLLAIRLLQNFVRLPGQVQLVVVKDKPHPTGQNLCRVWTVEVAACIYFAVKQKCLT
jgi:hypothetical protein